MSATTKKLNLLRADALTPQQIAAVKALYGATEVIQTPITPQTHEEVIAACGDYKEQITTVLRGEVPLPVPAMREGHEFIIVEKNGIIYRVTSIQVVKEKIWPPPPERAGRISTEGIVF